MDAFRALLKKEQELWERYNSEDETCNRMSWSNTDKADVMDRVIQFYNDWVDVRFEIDFNLRQMI